MDQKTAEYHARQAEHDARNGRTDQALVHIAKALQFLVQSR